MDEPANFYGIVSAHAANPSASFILREAARGEANAVSYVRDVATRARAGDPFAVTQARALDEVLRTTVRNMYTRRYLASVPRVPQHGGPPPHEVTGTTPALSYQINEIYSWQNQMAPSWETPPRMLLVPPGQTTLMPLVDGIANPFSVGSSMHDRAYLRALYVTRYMSAKVGGGCGGHCGRGCC